jgi:uncharacterized protein YjlB
MPPPSNTPDSFSSASAPPAPNPPDLLKFFFSDDGSIPNNPTLPVLVYKRALTAASPSALAGLIESTYAKNHWRAAWRWSVYDFPHYHSTAHEVLGCYRGSATLQLGGKDGIKFVVEPGDIVVLPAGTGHQNLGASDDFHICGGYPLGHTADLLRGHADERPASLKNIKAVPLPKSDPVLGDAGPLLTLWKK